MKLYLPETHCKHDDEELQTLSEEELLPPARGEEFRQLRSFASAGLSVTAMEKDDGREDADLIC